MDAETRRRLEAARDIADAISTYKGGVNLAALGIIEHLDAVLAAPPPVLQCPACGMAVPQVASATPELALWQHANWVCSKRAAESPLLPVADALMLKALGELADDLESIVQEVTSRDGDATARQHLRARAVRYALAALAAPPPDLVALVREWQAARLELDRERSAVDGMVEERFYSRLSASDATLLAYKVPYGR